MFEILKRSMNRLCRVFYLEATEEVPRAITEKKRALSRRRHELGHALVARTGQWCGAVLVFLVAAWTGVDATPTHTPFAGVTAETLLDAPMLGHGATLEARGAEILEYGTGMQPGRVHGEPVVITERDFSLEVTGQVGPGVVSLTIEAVAPTRSADSFYASVDGKRLAHPMALPFRRFGTISATTWIRERGRHRFRLTLHKKPGAAIRKIALGGKIASKRPAMRPELVGQHPRLLIGADDLPGLRARLDKSGVRDIYRVPDLLHRPPPAYQQGARNGLAYRWLASYALGYLLKPDPAQLQAVLAWLEQACTFGDVGVQLDSEYFLQGVALTYDWLHEQIPPDRRARVRDAIAAKTRQLFIASLQARQGGRNNFQQNHYWFANFAMTLGAAAIYGEVEEAEQWLLWDWDRFERIALTASPDGTFHEGPAYWDFSMPVLYMYTDLYEQLTGQSSPAGDNAVSGLAAFRFHHLLPGLERTVPLEDTKPDYGRPWIAPLLWEAKRFRNPSVMGMAKLIRTGASRKFPALLWLDESVVPIDPRRSEPMSRHFRDVGVVLARSSWRDDATFLAFVSRPLGGHRGAAVYEQYGIGGTGHNHPAQNQFVLFGRGEMLIGEAGYTYEKKTQNHNTVLVAGHGQHGDGQMWPRPGPGRARITEFVARDGVMIAAGDAASAYADDLGLRRFDRFVVLAGRDIVVYDRLQGDRPTEFTWLAHHAGKLERRNGSWVISKGAARLALYPMKPSQALFITDTRRPNYVHPTRDITPKTPELGVLALTTKPTVDATILVPMVVASPEAQKVEVHDASTAGIDAVRIGETLVAFNRAGGAIDVELPWGETCTTTARALVARTDDGKRRVVVAPAAAGGRSSPASGCAR